ncbi:MAG: dipeptidase [Pyrinomonadaceae bacterium]
MIFMCLRRDLLIKTCLLILIGGLISPSCRNAGNNSNGLKAEPGQPANKMDQNSPELIHRRSIVIDLHADTAQRLVDENVDLSQRLPDGHLDGVRMQEGGLDAQFFSIWVEPRYYGKGGPKAVARADAQINAVRALVDKYPNMWGLATTAADIRRLEGEQKLSALMGMEGGYAIDEKLENVEKYFRLGVRYMSPAWSVSTSWAGSSGDAEGRNRGLNEFGVQVVHEMNRLGMMVDVSHVSDQTFWDIIKTSDKPVIASHSNARALANVPRNLTDDMIRAIGQKGGVICVVFFPSFIDAEWNRKREQIDREIAPILDRAEAETQGTAAERHTAREHARTVEYAKRLPPISLAHLVDHIDYIVKLAGVDHVGLGSDFDGINATPEGLATVADLPHLTEELLRRGYSAGDVEKILGGNILRVMEAVESK